jgi:hypothetical protein
VRAIAALTIGVVLAATIPAAQQPQWYELYDEAIQHIKTAEWAQAETKLLKARELGPPSGRSVLRYGSLRPPFFPEFYLGIVYQATGRPAEASTQFALARKSKINVRDDEFNQIGLYEGMAKTALLNKPSAPLPPPKPDPKPDPPVNTDTGSKPATENKGPSAADASQFAELLATASTQLSQRNFDAAQQSARSAADLAIRVGLTADRPRAEALLRDIDGARYADRVQKALDQRDAGAARSALTVLTVAAPTYPADALRGRVDQLERSLRTTDLYRNAMRAFFGGNYSQALSSLSEVEKLATLTPRGQFYRACSLAALAAASPNPSQDPRLVDARRLYAAASAAAGDGLREDLRYVSPKIRQLLGVR